MNRTPIDRLVDIKQQMAVLKTEYEALRHQALSGEISLVGDEFIATSRAMTRRTIRIEKAEELLSPAQFEKIVETAEWTNLVTTPIPQRK